MGVRRGATWLQAAIRIDGGSAPPAGVRYMDQKIAECVGRKEKGMLVGRTHVKVEESSGDEEQPEQEVEEGGGVAPVLLQAVPSTSTPLWLG